jgi:Na+/H+ antiporter NhaD/arsenite permease-like protein
MIFSYKEYIALVVFVVVFFLIIERRRFNNVPIWTSMLIGAALMVGFQVISIQDTFKSINLDVIVFLFGMFSIVSALDKSGVLKFVALKIMLSKAKDGTDSILFVIIVGLGTLSAFLVNDTIALIGVPLIIHISRRIQVKSPTVLFLALAFGISVGSIMTPIGNPQNLLIAIKSGIPLPFLTFMKWLFIPTIANLFLTFFILKIYFKKELSKVQSYGGNDGGGSSIISADIEEEYKVSSSSSSSIIITNPGLAKISVVILFVTIVGFIISEILQFVLHVPYFSISVVAVLGSIVLYALSKERREILYSVDYSVLVFFAAMFVFTYGLWSSGLIPLLMSYIPNPSHDAHNIIQTNAVISAVSVIMSQIVSNVPFVSLYNNVMIHNGITSNDISQWMMLVAASTVAGNLTIFGAASNIIIIEAAESKGIKAFSYIEFLKIGSIVTTSNIVVYYLFIIMLF